MSNEAAALLARGAPATVARIPDAPFDANVAYAADNAAASIVDVPGAAEAVGLHGHLGPGTVGLIAPREHRGRLVGFLADAGNPFTQDAMTISTNVPPPVPPGVVVMYPGDVHHFERRFADGVSAYVRMPHVININRPNVGPHLMARLRVWPDGGKAPPQIRYQRTPCRVQINSTPAAAPTGEPATAQPVVGARYVQIAFRDNTTPEAAVVAAETGNYEVWWLHPSGLWVHHEDDDFDAAGRGAATDTHYVETYEVHGVVAVYVRRVSGSSFFWDITTMDTEGYPW